MQSLEEPNTAGMDAPTIHEKKEEQSLSVNSRRRFLAVLLGGTAASLTSAHSPETMNEAPGYTINYQDNSTTVTASDGAEFIFVYNHHGSADAGGLPLDGKLPNAIPQDTDAVILELVEPWGRGTETSSALSPEAHLKHAVAEPQYKQAVTQMHENGKTIYLAWPFTRGGQEGRVVAEIGSAVVGGDIVYNTVRAERSNPTQHIGRRQWLKRWASSVVFAASSLPLLSTLMRNQSVRNDGLLAAQTSKISTAVRKYHPLYTEMFPDDILKAAIIVLKLKYLAAAKGHRSIATIVGGDHPEIAEMFRLSDEELLAIVLQNANLIQKKTVDPASLHAIASFHPIQPHEGEPRNIARWKADEVFHEPRLHVAINMLTTGNNAGYGDYPELHAAAQLNGGGFGNRY